MIILYQRMDSELLIWWFSEGGGRGLSISIMGEIVGCVVWWNCGPKREHRCPRTPCPSPERFHVRQAALTFAKRLAVTSDRSSDTCSWTLTKIETLSTSSYLIEAETKWPPISWRHFQMHFLDRKCYNSDEKFTDILFLRVQLTIFQ